MRPKEHFFLAGQEKNPLGTSFFEENGEVNDI